MSPANLGAIAQRLFSDFLAPLVLGGEMKPGRPIGALAALSLGKERILPDIDRLAHVGLVRTRVGRRFAPIDRVEGPTEAEWALGAALHDLVQATHPGFDAVLRRAAPPRLLGFVHETLERVPPPRTLGEALGRHTWFARMFEIVRTDTVIRWWVGSKTFLGEPPPARLSAWPELRRVRVERTARVIMDLPEAGAAVDPVQFSKALTHFLAKTPMTDLATCHRSAPIFTWGSESLGLVGTIAGRTLVTRALSRAPKGAVDACLGRATRALVRERAWRAAGVAMDLLAERALSDASFASTKGEAPVPVRNATDDASYARSAGALVAWRRLSSGGGGFGESDCADLVARLAPLANTPLARSLASELAAER
jgi:hypothetical protein